MTVPNRLIEGLKIPVLINCDECGHLGMHLTATEENERCYLQLSFICPSCHQHYTATVIVSTLTCLPKEH